MGQRANLVIVHESGYELHYSKWAANTLPTYVFWGPGPFEQFVRAQQDLGDQWLDTIWCEGGAVMDLQRRVLLFFGGEDLPYDVVLRRFYFRLLRETWSGWDLRWAHRGIVDLARYCGVSDERVIARSDEERKSVDLSRLLNAPPNPRTANCIVSARVQDGPLKLFVTALPGVAAYLRAGPGLIEHLEARDGLEAFSFEPARTTPVCGVHFDIEARQIKFWQASDDPEVERHGARAWPGWTLTWLRDDLDAQIAELGGRVRLLTQCDDDLLEATERIVFLDVEGPLEGSLDFAEEGKGDAATRAWELLETQAALDRSAKRLVWAECLRRFRAGSAEQDRTTRDMDK